MSADVRGDAIAVDRTRCTGHGVCAGLLPGHVTLDEWGYPVVWEARVAGSAADRAIRLCPARAVYRPEASRDA